MLIYIGLNEIQESLSTKLCTVNVSNSVHHFGAFDFRKNFYVLLELFIFIALAGGYVALVWRSLTTLRFDSQKASVTLYG